MPVKPACKGLSSSCMHTLCRKPGGWCQLHDVFLELPEPCKGCGNLAFTVTCAVCALLDKEAK